MKRFIVPTLFLIFCFFFWGWGHAQITIQQEDVANWLATGNTLAAYADTTTQMINIGSPGESNWDFSSVQQTVNYGIQVVNPSRTEFDTSYSASNISYFYQDEVDNHPYEHWVYYNLNHQNLLLYGNVKRETEIPEITQTTYAPAENMYTFPLTFNSIWNQTIDGEIVLWHDGIPTTVESGTYMITATVDAFGSVIMPDGSEESCLRIKYDMRKIVEGDYTRKIRYVWLSISGKSFTVVTSDTTTVSGSISADQISWILPNSATGVTGNINTIKDYKLFQNYPNPFNPETEISYEIPSEGKVEIKVFNMLGKEMKTLVNKNQPAGQHIVSFSAADLPSGIYFARMRAGNFTRVIKMTLLK